MLILEDHLQNLSDLLLVDKPFYLGNFLSHPERYANWNTIEECINRPELFEFELIDKENTTIDIPSQKKAWVWHKKVSDKNFIFNKVNNGYTLVILNYGFFNRDTVELLAKFENLFNVRSAIHVYCGLEGSHSFPIHNDYPSNFIIQIEGITKWQVFNNRSSTLFKAGSITETIPGKIIDKSLLDLAFEVELKPGDALYLPSRCFHAAYPSEKRISLSIPCWSIYPDDDASLISDRNWYSINNTNNEFLFESRKII